MMNRKNTNSQAGFTLLEVILTISILAVMMISTSVLLRSSLDMKISLSQRSLIAGKMNAALTTLSKDISQAFMLSVNKDKERVLDGQVRTIFKYSSFGGGSTLTLTTMNNSPAKKNVHEGELAFVVYELKDSKAFPGRKDLYRGASGVVPSDFRTAPESKVIAKGIKAFSLEMWNGDSWLTEWSTEKSDFKQSIPKMVRITLVGYSMEPIEGEEDVALESDDFETRRVTAVYLPYSERFKELKSKTGSMSF